MVVHLNSSDIHNPLNECPTHHVHNLTELEHEVGRDPNSNRIFDEEVQIVRYNATLLLVFRVFLRKGRYKSEWMRRAKQSDTLFLRFMNSQFSILNSPLMERRQGRVSRSKKNKILPNR